MGSFSRSKLPLIAAYLLILVIIIGMQAFNIFSEVQNIYYDKFFISRAPGNKVVIVTIGDESLQSIGAWPWDREVFAQVLTVLDQAGARVIAFDVIFAESRGGDEALKRAVSDANAEIVFAGKLIAADDFFGPLSGLLVADNSESGFVNFDSDFDGKVRKALLFRDTNSGCKLSLSFLSVRSYLNSKGEPTCTEQSHRVGFSEFITQDGRIRINFAGGPGTFPRIKIADVLNGDFDAEAVKDKIILVGSTVQDLKSDLQDNLVSPFDGQVIPGVEMHANVIDTVLEGQFIYEIDIGLQLILTLMLGVISYLYNSKLTTFKSFLATVFLIFAVIVLAAFLFGLGYIINLLSIPILLFAFWIFHNFWRYYLKRKENEKIKKAFGQYVNNHILQEIIKDPSKLALGGEMRELTVLFSDIRGFTTLSEQLGVSKLVKYLNRFLTDLTNVILAKDGVVDKFIGDAIMAIWGAPLDDKDHAYHACQAAIEMQRALRVFNKTYKGEYPKSQIGAGINSGEMVVGNMGSEQRFDYSVLGDNVNLASRLEGLTKQYGVDILLGENVVKQLEETGKVEEFSLRKLDVVTVKGKEDSVAIYELMGYKNSSLDKLAINYEKALEEYIEGNFEEAVKRFRVLYKNNKDTVSKILAERAEGLVKEKPKQWKGVWNWKVK